jgi:nicotinamidase-related amidase
MALTELDPRTALIVIDLQAGTLSNPTVHPAADIVARATELTAAFRAAGRPIVFARVDGTPAGRTTYGAGAREYPAAFTELAPELDPHPEDLSIVRRTWDAFSGTPLQAQLAEAGITQVVLAGIATSFGVESTARHAYDLGFSVVVVSDAVTDLRPESHENSITRVFPVLGQVATTAEIVAVLAG